MTALFLGIIALLPLLVDVSAMRPFEPPKIFLFEIAVAVFAAAVFVLRGKSFWGGEKAKRNFCALDIAVLAFFGVMALASAFSIMPSLSFFGSDERGMGLLFFVALTVMYVGVRVTVVPDDWRRFWLMSVCVAFGIALYGIAQWFGFDAHMFRLAFPVYGSSGAERAFGTLGHPNFLGAYLAMLLPFVLLIRRLWLRIGIAAIISLGILFTYSRAAWAAALIGGTVAFLALEAGRVRRWILRLVVVGAITLFTLVVFRPMLLASHNSVLFRLGTMTDMREGSIRVRMDEWQFGSARLIQRPLFGYGPETYPFISILRVKNAHEAARGAVSPDPTVADRLHNLELDTLWNGGLALLAALIAMLWFALQRLLLWLHASADRVEPAAVLGSLVAWFVANQAGFDCSVTAILWMLLMVRIASVRFLL